MRQIVFAAGCILLAGLAVQPAAQAQVPYTETQDLTQQQDAAVKRFLASQEFAAVLDPASVVAYQSRPGKGKWTIRLSARTKPELSAEGVCRQRRFTFTADAAANPWKTLEKEEGAVAWRAKRGACGAAEAEIEVGAAITDREFLAIEQNQKMILSKSFAVIAGNSGCATYTSCEMRLSGIRRLRDEGTGKAVISLSFTPPNASPCANEFFAEVSYQGPAHELWPIKAICWVP